ncbi:MAG: nucleotidyltransferase domain-containing protein [Synergistaceae bacterium]|jgi:type I restriction enzyme S subunit|nr:nucleotidyltransferase domain-containing protein [Synergistaceae bacterium]
MIADDVAAEIKKIIHDSLPGAQVFFFGSRVKKTNRPNSDIDVLVKSEKKLTLRQLARLNDALTESDIPYVADVHDYYGVSAEFLSGIADDLTE